MKNLLCASALALPVLLGTVNAQADEAPVRPFTFGYGVTMHLSDYRGFHGTVGVYPVPKSDVFRIDVGFEHSGATYAGAEYAPGEADLFTFTMNGGFIKPELYLFPGNKYVRTMFYAKATMSAIHLKNANDPDIFDGSKSLEFSGGGGIDITVNSYTLFYSQIGFGYRTIAGGNPPDAYVPSSIFGEFMTGFRFQFGRLMPDRPSQAASLPEAQASAD